MTNETKQKSIKIRVRCVECGKRWRTSNPMPQCSRCNSVDIEPADEFTHERVSP